MIKLISIIVLGLLFSITANGITEDYIYSEPTATYYYAMEGGITASGYKVNPEKVKNGEHRWIAVSRDLKTLYRMGDTVIIESKDCPELNGSWVVRDLMSSRMKNKIDFLVHRLEVKNIGFNKPHKVKMRKKKE